jgi:hypothetical protein
MLARRVFAVGLGLFAFSEQASATAQMSAFDPTQGFAPTLVNFDDPSGKGFTWEKSLPCGANRATVTVRFKRAYQSGTIMPVAKVWLHSGKSGDPSEQWIAAVLKAPTDTYKLDAMEWLEKVVGSQSEGPGYAPANLSGPLQIDFAWTSDGVVSVNFGGEFVKYIKTNEPISDIGLSVSWAKFEFIGLKVGRAGAPDPACASKTLLAHLD